MRLPLSLLGALFSSTLVVGAGALVSSGQASEPASAERAALGEALFFDTSLSLTGTQSCASCHDPAHAFADPRKEAADGAVSVGADGISTGTRNAPSITYAAITPAFHRDAKGDPVGGQFRDGRADTLEDQAGQPLLNPAEMAMPDKESVVARLRGNPDYVRRFRAIFGDAVLDTDESAFAALTEALAAYERSPAVSPFDSKYDRALRGEYKMTPQEELGMVLFFSNQFTNCHLCHKLTGSGLDRETFSNYSYHNIGVPKNPELKIPTDHGLMDRPDMKEAARDGLFKVPSLRNIAVTAPYMHNGVFKDLRTAVLFYDKYNSKSPKRQLNPETAQAWGRPEVDGTISTREVEFGPALDDRRINALVAFLETLTDKRYEALLDQ